jgi:hypothetical protein
MALASAASAFFVVASFAAFASLHLAVVASSAAAAIAFD